MSTPEERNQNVLDLIEVFKNSTKEEILTDDTLSETFRALKSMEMDSVASKLVAFIVERYNQDLNLLEFKNFVTNKLSEKISQEAWFTEKQVLDTRFNEMTSKHLLASTMLEFEKTLATKQSLATTLKDINERFIRLGLKDLVTRENFVNQNAIVSSQFKNAHALDTEFAAADLTDKKGYACKITATGINLVASAGGKCDGVLKVDTANVGMNAPIDTCKDTEVMSGAAFTKGDYLTPDANSKWVLATTGNEITFRAMQDATAGDELVKAFFIRAGKAD